MNIFVLDRDIERCARYHCDQHVVKMILESAQIICSALSLHGFETPYRPTHSRHPCVRWTADSFANLAWLKALAEALNREYRYRYDKAVDHKSMAAIAQTAAFRYPDVGLTPFAVVVPDRYRDDDPVLAYRRYYRAEKLAFARWTKRSPPDWV